MTKILAIAWKDLRSIMRNVPALVMMLVAPLALAGLLGFAFGGGDSFQISATKVAVASADTAPAASPAAHPIGDELVGVLTSAGLKDVLEVTQVKSASAARRRVDDGDAANAVVIPSGFSEALYGTQGGQAQVELYVNPTQGLGDAITSAVVNQTLQDFNGARAAAAAAAAVAPPSFVGRATRQAAAQFLKGGGVGKALVVTEREPLTRSGKEGKDIGVTGLILAGMMVFFMFFGASNVARTLLTEDRDGTLPRLLTTPTPPGTVLAGKFSSVFLTVTVQSVVLLVAGRILFSIDWGRLDAVALLTLVGAAVASGLALLVISVVRSPAQAGAIGAGVYLVLALLGGNFAGTATTTGTYAVIQKFTPNGWLLRGWDTAMHGGSAADVVPLLIVPFALAVVFFVVAVVRFRRRYA